MISKASVSLIATELKADYVVEGGVQRNGDHVRIMAKLIRASDQLQIWTGSYERDVRKAVALQTDVAVQITVAVIGDMTGTPV